MADIIKLQNDTLSIGISTLGAELQYVNGAEGTEFLWNADPAVWSGRAPVLFPICGRLKGNEYTYGGVKYEMGGHGFARRREFVCESADGTSAVFSLLSDEESRKIYPFDFKLTVAYKLSGNSVGVTYKIENLTDGEMYFSIGSHEGYLCPEGIEAYDIEFDGAQTLDAYSVEGPILDGKCSRVIEDESILPLRNEHFAIDALVFKDIPSKRTVLARRGGGRRITVEHSDFRHLLIWSRPGTKLLCIEPWNGMPDSVDRFGEIANKESIIRLESGESREMIHTITFEA